MATTVVDGTEVRAVEAVVLALPAAALVGIGAFLYESSKA